MAPLSNFVPSTFTGAPSDASSTPIDPSSSSSSPAVEEDCISCRIIGGATFAGLGGYAMYESVYQGALKKGGEPKTRVLTLGALGAGESSRPLFPLSSSSKTRGREARS
ncbi:hypothetical protein BDY24DRAFT_27382 [Mrakia frigida]|uniref:uncharacterized protein n=1 Tax=Mrakia frigida TaxID=29902 RepID=UPI003FCC077D